MEIGGYFELELPKPRTDFIHSGCRMVNSGRHALEYILRGLGHKIQKIFIPYFTCDVVLQPIRRTNLRYEFYNVNENLEIASDIRLGEGDYILINNYFGVKDEYVNRMATKYKGQIIIDNAQAWYAPEILGFNIFYSPRKFFGMPDGGCAFATFVPDFTLEKDHSHERCSHLLKRIDVNAAAGYDDFHSNSALFKEAPLKEMSNLSLRLLSSIEFENAKIQRRTNYTVLDEALRDSNRLKLPSMHLFECPMVYPYYVENGEEIRKKLIYNKIFVATYWPNVLRWCDETTTEHRLARNLLALPIDQRYDADDMEKIIGVINPV